jgi:hypothetical protein
MVHKFARSQNFNYQPFDVVKHDSWFALDFIIIIIIIIIIILHSISDEEDVGKMTIILNKI